MPDQSQTNPQAAADVLACLHEVAQVLRQAHHLEPAAQRALADLVDELSRSVNPADLPSVETAHLAQTTVQLARALDQQHDETVLARARERLEAAAAKAEVQAPRITGPRQHRSEEHTSELQ